MAWWDNDPVVKSDDFWLSDPVVEQPKVAPVGRMEAFSAGVGRGSQRLADGLVQAYYGARSMMGDEQADPVLRGLKSLDKSEGKSFEAVKSQRPFLAGAGEAIPTALASFLPGGKETAFARMMTPALYAGAAEGAAYGDVGERAGRAGVMGATTLAGAGVGELLGKAIRPVARGQVSKEAIAAADRIGAPLSAGQRSGSAGLRKFEDMLAQSPGSAGVMSNLADDAHRAVNRAVAKEMGANVDDFGRLTQQSVLDARAAAGLERDALRAAVNVNPVHPQVLAGWNKAEKAISIYQPKIRDAVLDDDVVKMARDWIAQGNALSGPEYQALRTTLREAKEQAFRSGATGAKAKGAFIDNLLDGLKDAAESVNKGAWKASDRKFATMELLEKGQAWNQGTGNVNAKTFANNFMNRYGTAAKEGALPGAGQDVMLFARGVPEYSVGSQTAPRQAFSDVLKYAASPVNYLAARGLTNPTLARYIASGAVPDSPFAQDMLVRSMRKSGVTGGLLSPAALQGLLSPALTE